MNIVIDTNIFRRDLKLTDRNFDILLDYLSKTNSKILLPQIVIEEIRGLYKRVILDRITDYEKSLKKLNGYLTEFEVPLANEISIEGEVESYMNTIESKLNLNEDSIVPYKNAYLPELVKRAIDRKKPLGSKGQQFRDGILWLTLLDIADSVEGKRIVFISDNPSDFAEKGINELNYVLQEECNSRSVEINYFKSLDDFVKKHAAKISFVTDDWINKNVDTEKLILIFEETLEKEEEQLKNSLQNLVEPFEQATGYIGACSYQNLGIMDYFVYEMADGSTLLNLDVVYEKEYEMEIIKMIERDSYDFEYRYHTDPETGDLDMDYSLVPKLGLEEEVTYKMAYPYFKGKFVLTIKNEKIVDYDFKEWDWG